MLQKTTIERLISILKAVTTKLYILMAFAVVWALYMYIFLDNNIVAPETIIKLSEGLERKEEQKELLDEYCEKRKYLKNAIIILKIMLVVSVIYKAYYN